MLTFNLAISVCTPCGSLVYITRFLTSDSFSKLTGQTFIWVNWLFRKLSQKMGVRAFFFWVGPPCKWLLLLWYLFIGNIQCFCRVQLQLARPAWSSTLQELPGTSVWGSTTMNTQTYKSMLACTLPAARDSWYSRKVLWYVISWYHYLE